jgi:HAE1 family hydrophobic/amphiphilic exporter-1
LITSTALSLMFVPVVFSLIDGLKRRMESRLSRLTHGQHGHEEPAVEDRIG